jgi:hypothetical protein
MISIGRLPVAVALSAEDAAGTEIDCRECLAAMGETELAD